MNIRLVFLFLISFVSCTGLAANSLQGENTSSKYPEDVVRVNHFADYIVNELGYAGVSMIGFDKGKTMSLSSIYMTRSEYDFIRVAEVSDIDGVISFRTYKKCTVTIPAAGAVFIDKVITVDGQRILAAYSCSRTPDDRSKTQEVFVVKSSEGRRFIHNKFFNQQYVFVGLDDGLEVPFSTKGFRQLWDRVNSPAL